ncbi:Trigger factor [uncultured Roseburia sp.]|uniref:Trigger factor n=1 Tax=Brotonthovivens ammoniilytica TaxID=2981725 RepID=A0ABT2TJI8_9FIRM|nr:trigger factor [Brotonthovivens ammoniilytica]MCU6762383.1 trigger factor [Brotonthovivens ammoniilytica]SCI70004.1 Trigger factor [uncultured Roseburia sp.]
MSVQVENLEKNMAKLTVEVPAEELESALQEAYNKQKKSISLPGFRKGKVPRMMVEKMYGANVFCDDAANSLLPGAYSEAVEESGLDIVSRPNLDIVQLEKGKAFIFTAEVAVKPEVTLGKYVGVTVTKIDTAATEEEIEKEINAEREKNARTITVEGRAVEDGDTAVIDYEGFADGVAFEGGKDENHSLVIGSGSFIPGFEEQLIGKNAGEEVEVNVTFPEEYHSADLAGKAAVFNVKINEIKTKEVPELDDEFVQDVSEFDTVAEYKESIKAKVEERKESDAKAAQTDEAIKKIVDKSQMDIPEAMIDTQCEDMINQFGQQMSQQGLSMQQYLQFTGMTMDKMKEQVREEAVARIESGLILEQIAKEENIEISDEDLDAEIVKMAELYKMEADQLRGYMGDSEKEAMKKDLAEQRAVAFIMENVKYRAKAKSKKEKDAEAEAESTEE